MKIEEKLNNTLPLQGNDIQEIISLSKQHPYWYVPTAILARNFRITSSDKIQIASGMAALRIANQHALYSLVYEQTEVITSEKSIKETAIAEVPVIDLVKEEKIPTIENNIDIDNIQEIEDPAETGISEETNIEAIHTDKELTEEIIIEQNEIVEEDTIEINEQELEPETNEQLTEESDIDSIENEIELVDEPKIEENVELESIAIEPNAEELKQTSLENEVENTIEEIEKLIANSRPGFNLIPDPNFKSAQVLDELETVYDITQHFTLSKDITVNNGEDFYYWLQNASNQEDFIKKKRTELLDNFIKTNPSITKLSPEIKQSDIDYSINANEIPLDIATETLARVYSEQGNYKMAKKIYTQLMLKFPLKKAYFASQIKNLE